MLSIAQATGALVLIWLLVITAVLPLYYGIKVPFPRSIPVLFFITLLLTIGGSRQIARWLLLELATTTSTEIILRFINSP